jgi:hypothetical protein
MTTAVERQNLFRVWLQENHWAWMFESRGIPGISGRNWQGQVRQSGPHGMLPTDHVKAGKQNHSFSAGLALRMLVFEERLDFSSV